MEHFKAVAKTRGGLLVELSAEYGTIRARLTQGDLSVTIDLADTEADKLGQDLIYWAGVDSPVFSLIERDKENERARKEAERQQRLASPSGAFSQKEKQP